MTIASSGRIVEETSEEYFGGEVKKQKRIKSVGNVRNAKIS